MLRHFIICYWVLERRDNVKESANPAKGEKERERARESSAAAQQVIAAATAEQTLRSKKALVTFSPACSASLPISLYLSWVWQLWALRKSARETQTQHIHIHTYLRTLRIRVVVAVVDADAAVTAVISILPFSSFARRCVCVFIFNCISNWTVRASLIDK